MVITTPTVAQNATTNSSSTTADYVNSELFDVIPEGLMQDEQQQLEQHTQHNRELNNMINMVDLWSMNEPSSTFDNITKTYRLTYEVNDMITDSMFQFTLWKAPDCEQSGTLLPRTGIGYEVVYFNDGKSQNAIDGTADGSSKRQFGFEFQFEEDFDNMDSGTNIFDNPDLYRFDHALGIGFGTICVRASLYTPSPSNDDTSVGNGNGIGIEVNFIESIVGMKYDLRVERMTVTAYIDKSDNSESWDFSMGELVKAYFCIPGNKRITQGTVIQVCVEPKGAALRDGFRVRTIDHFYYEKPSAGLFQDAVIDGKKTTTNELSLLYCDVGSSQCIVQTMLYARFYAFEEEIIARGAVTFQFGSNDNTMINDDDDENTDCVGFECNNEVTDQDELNQVFEDDSILIMDEDGTTQVENGQSNTNSGGNLNRIRRSLLRSSHHRQLHHTSHSYGPNHREQKHHQTLKHKRGRDLQISGVDKSDQDNMKEEFQLPFDFIFDRNDTDSDADDADTNGNYDNNAFIDFIERHCSSLGLCYSIPATIGISLLILFNLLVLCVMLHQLPYFKGRRLYI